MSKLSFFRTLPLTLALTSLTACARPALTPAALHAPHPPCRPAANPPRPTLCARPGQTDLFIVGLRPGEPWNRGDRVLLEIAPPELDHPLPAAVVEVTEREHDFAKVHLLAQTEPKPLDGARARRLGTDERAPLGRAIARITQVEPSRVHLDVGALDSVAVGDVYAILSPRDHAPMGRVEITEAGEQDAWGKQLDAREPLQAPLDAVWLRGKTPAGTGQTLRILVVSFDPQDPGDLDARPLAKRSARELADALATAAAGSPDLVVRFAAEEQVRPEAGDAAGHAAARRLAARYPADVVVWGSLRCGRPDCAAPRVTFVDPDRLRARSSGEALALTAERGGFSFAGTPNQEAVAAAILGAIYAEAERLPEARYYLAQALAKDARSSKDELRARLRLAYALAQSGQILAARIEATALVQHARAARLEDWEQWGRAELWRSLYAEGHVDAAHAELRQIARWSEAHRSPDGIRFATRSRAAWDAWTEQWDRARELYEPLLKINEDLEDHAATALTLQALGQLDAEEGDAEEARVRFERAFEIAERIGDVAGQIRTLHAMGALEAAQENAEEARALFQGAIDLSRSTGALAPEARTRHELGALEYQQGNLAEAHGHAQRALDLARRLGDVRGEARALNGLASVVHAEGKLEEMRALYQELLDLTRRRGEVDEELRTLRALAIVEQYDGGAGGEDRARALLHRALALAKRRGKLSEEAQTLQQMGELEEYHRRPDAARALYQEAIELQERAGDVFYEDRTLHLLASLEAEGGRPEEARALYQRALDLERRAGHLADELTTLIDLALLDYAQGKKVQAREAVLAVLERARAQKRRGDEIRALSTLGDWDMAEGYLVQARERWEEVKALESAEGRSLGYAQAHLNRLVPLEKAAEAWRAQGKLLAEGGALVTEVEAEGEGGEAGIAPGDIVLRYGVTRVDRPLTLEQLAKGTEPSVAVKLELVRGAQKLTVQVHGGPLGVELANLPSSPPAPKPTP